MLAILLTTALATGARLPIADIDSGFGDRRIVLAAPGEIQPRYGHAFGSMRIENADSALAAGTTPLETSVAFGELRVSVPDGVGLRISASTIFGATRLVTTTTTGDSTRVRTEELGAFSKDEVISAPGYEQAAKRIDLWVHTAFGETRVSRGQP